jgi:translocation protein SEC72
VYAFATVDLIYTVFWFSAWICLASYVAQGKSIGKSSSDDSSSSSSSSSTKSRRASSSTKSGCDNWAYGSAGKCKISTATTIIGVFILYVDLSSPIDSAGAITSN